jgi:UDP:flavonoid glycosyltransferase YjiC (YdhE family)
LEVSCQAAKKTISLLSEAAKLASVRAASVVGMGKVRLNQHWRLFCRFSSSRRHFSHCRAIVHHGGAGTSQSALRAGKPSVVVAHTAEQELWGRELKRIGVASKLLLRRKLTSSQLAAAIELVVGSSGINERANRLGREVSMENGVAIAVRLISNKFPAQRSSPADVKVHPL